MQAWRTVSRNPQKNPRQSRGLTDLYDHWTNERYVLVKRLICLPCVVFTLLIGPPAHAATLRTVALTGQQVPGAPDGTVFTWFNDPPVLNDAGQTAFRGPTAFQGPYGIWSEGSGSLELVAAVGQQAPGMPDGVSYRNFDAFGRIVINDAGMTAFSAQVIEPGSGSAISGIWTSGPGGSALVVRDGQQAAGTPDGVHNVLGSFLHTFVMNDAGQVAFQSPLLGSSSREGIWAQRQGNLELVALTGSQAPGMAVGVNFSRLVDFRQFSLNNLSQTAFWGALTGSGVDTTNNVGLWSEGSGSLALVARKGGQAPGMPDGVVFSGSLFVAFTNPALNSAGRTAFAGRVAGAGVDSTNDQGIWSEASGSLALVVRSGTPAPGTPSGVNFKSFSSRLTSPVLNDAGEIAFFAALAGPGVNSTNNLGLWAGASGSLALVARMGDHAPGTEDGVVFGHFANVAGHTPNDVRHAILNAAGQTAFFSPLRGSGINDSNDRGIWATDRSGALQLIAREGDLLEVAPGDFRMVSNLTFLANVNDFSTGNSDGRPSAFNNLGQLAFNAAFTDGTSGIFVSNRVAVPEPSSLLLAAFAGVGLLCRRRVREA